ncbi:MAG: hypothetical protein IPJ52_14720 [Rhodocyclaceae bacterium]|nr:hypothetical protein [Rhodocyclaceae bacterium]
MSIWQNWQQQKQRSASMAKKLDDVMGALPVRHRAKIELRAQELASLKD